MQLRQRIDALINLGKFFKELTQETPELEEKLQRAKEILIRAENENGWFTSSNIHFALKTWSDTLTRENLEKWVAPYPFKENNPKTIAVIMAGNIPLVGFHDFLSVLISGNKVLVKPSSNDKVLLPLIADFLIQENPEFRNLIEFSDQRLKDFDAVIATGSNNTARYFDFYFGKYPNIIRKNRNSVAVLSGKETKEELERLADDIFTYFGLGCRNVSKIYIPHDYDFKNFFEAAMVWKDMIYNHKYMNNYDYNKAVYLMGEHLLWDNEFLLLKEDPEFSSPIAVLFYEKYDSIENVKDILESESDRIQCVVSNLGFKNEIAFGETQKPKLWEYADGVDTLDFLLNL